MRWLVLPLTLVLALAPHALAGEASDPEISEDADDGSAPVNETDIVAAWIADDLVELDDGLALDIYVKVAGDFQHPLALHAAHIEYYVGFAVEGLPEETPYAYAYLRPDVDEGSDPPGEEVVS